MSIGAVGYGDAVTRVSQIQEQIAGLRTAFVPPSRTTSQTTAPTGTSAATGTGTAGPTGATPTAGGGAATTFSSALANAMGTTATGTTGNALPAKASSMLTSGQQQFASRLATDTGLDPGVISAWVLSEESGGAASSRQNAGNNDWLNIGYTDSGTYGSSDSVWSDPIGAADATAGWLKGQNTIPGYGTASAGVQAILHAAGQPPADQIAAVQHSGWASSGYPQLASTYQQIAA